MGDAGADDEQRYRPQSRSAFAGAVAMFALAGIFALLGYASTAVGMAAVAGASLALAAIYFVMYRV